MSESGADGGGSTATSSGTGPQTLVSYIRQDMVATTFFFLRMTTIIASLVFVLSTFGLLGGGLLYSAYFNALMSAFFTFTMRLYQRKKQQTDLNLFSKRMLEFFVSEDSGHYMIYCFFYYNQPPHTLYLLPVFLYAVLSSVTYTNGLVPFLPSSMQRVVSRLNQYIASSQNGLKRFIAYTEVLLLLVVIANVFSGRMFFLSPLMQYQFIKLRYQSRRNPYVRVMFSDLRVGAEHVSRHPNCPAFLSNLIQASVSFVSRLAPTERMRREA